MTSPVVRPTATICRPASFVWFLTVVFLCFALCAPVATAGDGAAAGGKNAAEAAQGEKAQPAQPSPGEKFVAEATVKLENFTFGAADLAAAARYAKQAKTPAQRLPFALLAARYHREYENRPDRAAAEVLPHLFNKNVVADWEKATARLRQGNLNTCTPKSAQSVAKRADTLPTGNIITRRISLTKPIVRNQGSM